MFKSNVLPRLIVLWGTLWLTSVTLANTPESNQPQQAAETHPGFLALYQENRQLDRPNYITADFWLLAYSLVRHATLKELEQQQIRPLFAKLLDELYEPIQSQSTDPANIANQDYLQILKALLSGQNQVDSERAQQELALIQKAEGIAQSPLWDMKLDYSQFKPRGRYTDSDADRQYFQAMRYASSVLFTLKASAATGVSEAMAERMTQQALWLAQMLAKNPTAQQLEQRLAWQMGPADDLTAQDLITATHTLKKPSTAELQKALLDYAKKQGKQPLILSGLVDASKLEPGVTAADVLTGFRLLPLRYTADSAVFQQMLYPNTGVYDNDCKQCPAPFGLSLINGQKVKGFPSAYEIMALLDSPTAEQYVTQHHENRFKKYAQASKQAAQSLQNASGLNAAQITLLKTWFGEKPSSPDQAQDQLIAALGFWTWQRYTELLYSKQAYTLIGKGIDIPIERPGARLEPATVLYQVLLELVKQHRQHTPNAAWDELAQWLERAIVISQIKNNELSAEDNRFLNELDKALLHLNHGEFDQPIVVDVHTHPGENRVVEEATGLARVVKQDNAVGARFSHHEFKQPLNNRLDNESWRKQLAEQK